MNGYALADPTGAWPAAVLRRTGCRFRARRAALVLRESRCYRFRGIHGAPREERK